MRRILWPADQQAEHERAKRIALKWRTRNMRWLDRKICDFIMRVRDGNPIGANPRNPIAIGSEGFDEAGRPINPTYWRWYVWPRNRFINCYLHNFLRDDEEDLHDHRMLNISVVLSRIGYREELFLRKPHVGEPLPGTYLKRVEFMRPRIRFPSTPHRVVLWKDGTDSGSREGSLQGKPIPIWSLFIGFPHWQDWAFWCRGVRNEDGSYRGQARRVPWQEYIGDVDPQSSHYGKVGKGCS